MCNLCNGTHVIYEYGGFFSRISTCPNCGPIPSIVSDLKMATIRNNIRELKEKLSQ